MKFPPIAIVGQSCVLPGALSPDELWDLVIAGRTAIAPVPDSRWGIERGLMMAAPGQPTADRVRSDVGGYVSGFSRVWDPSGFATSATELAGLDPLFHWVLHVGRDALLSSRFAGDKTRVGAVIGNLSYPSESLSGFAEQTWLRTLGKVGQEIEAHLDRPDVDPRNRFMSGLPAHLLAHALGLGLGGFAIDAACASSLYAIKFACDALHDGRADLMLAGAVNRADDLFIHAGFTALGALSPTGQSRPFHADADGLVPGQGAAMLALRRLDDAERDGNPILAVIRGIGLSNDGRGRGLLVPTQPGQVRALRSAYEGSGVAPTEVSLVECHATGTQVGDAVEIRTMAEVFSDAHDPVPIGSLKANLGHLITVAGAAGLIKVLGALRHGQRPPTPGITQPTADLNGTPLRLLHKAETWNCQGPRRAAISAFGFGGNNAHLIVEEAPTRRSPVRASHSAPSPASPIAIVALGARVGSGTNLAAFITAVTADPAPALDLAASSINISMTALRFPPKDLEETLPQQLLLFAAAQEAMATAGALPLLRTGVFIGMQCDPEIARHGARWRLGAWAYALGASESWLVAARNGFVPLLGAAGVVGAMPNIPANRLSSHYDLGGPSLTVSAEELSGLRALELAQRALAAGDIDAAVVGAVDLCADPVHQTAATSLSKSPGGDAAVVLVLRRLQDARREGAHVMATLGLCEGMGMQVGDGPGAWDVSALFGRAHAAVGLVQVAAAVVLCDEGRISRAEINVEALGDARAQIAVMANPGNGSPRAKTFSPEPCLTFPAHAPPPSVPPLGAPKSQPMPPAPMLPATSQRPSVTTGNVAIAVSPRHRMAEIHRDFLATQTALHEAFLAGRTRTLNLALGHSPVGSVNGPLPPKPPADPIAPIQFSRADLEIHARGRISTLFGPAFLSQDKHVLQVRMPEPPLLLCDRVVGIKADPGSMGLGTVWTETDVHHDSWYLNRGFMPAGIMIEAGQADLFLISYLGIDALNQGHRAYRLLGCELTYHNGLPRPPDTLRYAIHIDGHANQGDVRLFFFHYDCSINGRPALTVRHGQAGFFSKDELEGSAGVLWSPEPTRDHARVDPPVVARVPNTVDAKAVRAFAQGQPYHAFGPGFERSLTHVRSPAIAVGDMLLVDHISTLDPKGGPWGRGYLKAVTPISPDDWFFAGHFKNDPCMPGTLMFEGCLQAMAIYLAALGTTLDRDGWRFEPVPDEPYKLQCRGQVLPTSQELVCELFVEEFRADPIPTLYADLLGTVDGRKAFHARRVGLQLVPDWPLSDRPALLTAAPDQPVSAAVDGFVFNYQSLLACAWGKPSDAFGPMYARFDGHRRVARLPGPPYHFMSNVTQVTGDIGVCEPGATTEITYDIPPDAWYFSENGHPTMPFCVLLEAVLQPCGWLASYVGSALLGDEDLSFRNLDGKGRVLCELPPGTESLRTRVKLQTVSRSGSMIIQTFEVRCFAGDTPVYDLETAFGFFPKDALRNQVGLPTTPAQRALYDSPANVHLTPHDRAATSPRLPGPMLLMLDRVTVFDPQGGPAGLGFARAEKDVRADEWFFKAHFFQDPVQPGSLGIEAMLQLLQFTMRQQGMASGLRNPRFVPIDLDREFSWKYRGQVVPENQIITTTLEITAKGRDGNGVFAVADASLWIDGKRIYQATGLGMRIVDESTDAAYSAPDLVPQVASFWRGWFNAAPLPVEDIHRALVTRFLRTVHVHASQDLKQYGPGGVIFLANHQTRIESTIFGIVASALMGAPVLIMSTQENRQHWLELLMQHTFSYPGLPNPQIPRFVDRSDTSSMPGIIDGLAAEISQTGRSLLVHVEGTRSLSCRQPVERMSSAFIDLAISLDRPIIPVRFTGGLPVIALDERAEFPVGLGQQDMHLGPALTPTALAALPYRDRRTSVLAAINALGPAAADEQPLPPDSTFESRVRTWMTETSVPFGHAVFHEILRDLPDPCPAIAGFLRGEPTKGQDREWFAELGRRLRGD